MFQKRNSFSDSSRGTSTQTIVNNVNNTTEECKTEMIDMVVKQTVTETVCTPIGVNLYQ